MARTDIAYDMYRYDLVLRSFQVEQDFAVSWNEDKMVLPQTLETDKRYNVSIPIRYSTDIVGAEGYVKCLFCIEGKEIELKAYQLPLVSFSLFSVYADADGVLHLSNAGTADLTVDKARHQNSLMTLICIPGNYHRFPASGVGLYRYLHDRTLAADFGERVQNEFTNDGVTVTDLQYDYETGKIDIKTKENPE